MAPFAAPPHPAGSALLVVQPLKRRHCAEGRGGPPTLLVLEEGAPRCPDCADLAHLVFLPRGDTALTRRSREAGGLSAVVVRFSRRRGRYERQGPLVEEAALAARAGWKGREVGCSRAQQGCGRRPRRCRPEGGGRSRMGARRSAMAVAAGADFTCGVGSRCAGSLAWP